MKIKALIILAVMFFSYSIVNAYEYKQNEKQYIERFQESKDAKVKANMVIKLCRMKSKKAFKIFVNVLAFPNRSQTPGGDMRGTSGSLNYVRTYIAFYLRLYKSLPEEELKYSFQVIRKLVDNSKDLSIVMHALHTIIYWAKNMGKDYQSLVVNSINKKISRVNQKNPRLVYSLIRAIKILMPHEDATRLATRLLAKGLNNRAERMLRKILPK